MQQSPTIPDGRQASFEQMAEARAAVAAWVDSGIDYLDCVKSHPFLHNLVVERLERTAGRFNRERARYLRQREAIASS